MLYKLILLVCCCPILVLGQNVDVKHLSLDLQFDWAKKQAFGKATIVAAVAKTSDTVCLDAGKLSIGSVQMNRQSVKFHYDGGDADHNLVIILDRIYRPNETFTLEIAYHTRHENRADPNAIGGSFGKGLRFQQPTSTTPNKRKQIWSHGEPGYNKYWFPCNEDIADIHTTEIRATLEKPLMLIGNGRLVSVVEQADGYRTFHYKSDRPFPNYLVSIVVGEYADTPQKRRQTLLHNYGYPHEKHAVEATVALLPDMMRFLETQTGYAYPFQTYSQTVVQDYPFPGLVGQHAASILSDNYIDDYGVHEDFKYLWDGVAVQALANQWFGNLIMPRSWGDIWLNNAFAQYFAGRYTAKCYGNAEYLTYYYPFEKGNVLSDWNTGNIHPVALENVEDPVAFSSDSYSRFKGALVLRMLEKEMGESSWQKCLRYYVKTHARRQVKTIDFQRAIEKITGKSYQRFFDQWIYKVGLPKLEAVKKYDAAQKRLSVTVQQVQSPDRTTPFQQTPFFEGTIAMEIDDRIERVYLKPQFENTFVFSAAQAPRLVHFNFEETFLCETVFEKSNDEYLYQLQNSKDLLARQQAIDQLTASVSSGTNAESFKDKVTDALIAEVRSSQYWRYRLYALSALRRILVAPYHEKMVAFLLETVKKEKSWMKSAAISMLGNSADATYQHIYINALMDESDRVINAAAIALGKTKSAKAYDILVGLENKPSWKNQNRISALNGLQYLGDPRAVQYALQCLKDKHSPRWYLATPIWDYPFAAVQTLLALGKADLAYPILIERFKTSLSDEDLNDIFQNVQLINLLQDERATEMYELLNEKFKTDAFVLEAVRSYQKQFSESLKK